MPTVTEHMRRRLMQTELYRTEWCDQFEIYMRNRLVMGALRYGRMHDHSQPKRDHIKDIIKRAKRYLADGNQEHLIDVANLAMIEFVRPGSHAAPHWSPVDDGDHCGAVEPVRSSSEAKPDQLKECDPQ